MEIVIALIQIAAAVLIQAALAPRQAPPKPAAFDEFDFPQAEEGTPIPVTFGDCWTEDWTVIGVGNYRTSAIEQDTSKK